MFRVEQPRITPVDATLRIKPEQPDEVHVDDLVVQVAVLVEDDGAKTETMSDETAERMARTRFIVDEYTMGVLDEQEAGERLFRHLFPHWG